MKKSLVRRRSASLSGFTLVELLVVIGIIAILAGVLLSAGGAALKSAQRAKVANTANQIQTAALNYYTEYSVYPVPSGTPASADFLIADTDAVNWKSMLYGLCGNINPYDTSTTAPGTAVSNTRGIAFLSLKSADVDINGGPKNPLAPDTAHIYFNMAIDNDYDGILGATPSVVQLPNFTTAKAGIDPLMTGSSTAGIAIWANCNGNITTKNPSFWVHTY